MLNCYFSNNYFGKSNALSREVLAEQIAFWPFKIIKVDDFGTKRKRVCDYIGLFVPHCGCTQEIREIRDTATYLLKNTYFSYSSLIRRPRSLCSRWNFALRLRVNHEEIRVMGLCSSEFPMIVARVMSHVDTVPTCVRQTDRETGGRTDLL